MVLASAKTGLYCVFLVSLYIGGFAAKSEDFLKAAKGIEKWIVKHRRALHEIPELQYDLPETNKYVQKVLKELGIAFKSPVAKSGIVATIGSGYPIVALRADMDALPIQEPKGLPFASKHEGKMHACGHDAHMAMLLGGAKLLKEKEKNLKGTVRLIFQPAEEGQAGAREMIKEGAIQNVSSIFGFHVAPFMATGRVSSRAGTLLASTNSLQVRITGKGGHAAAPHNLDDPWPAVAQLILGAQTLVSRNTNPTDSNVLSISVVKGGSAFNAIPDFVDILGTMRSLQKDGILLMEERFKKMANNIASGFNCEASVNYSAHYPATVNDANAYKFGIRTATSLFGKEKMEEALPAMFGEDFAYYGREIPSGFFFLGTKDPAAGSRGALHSPALILDESVLTRGAALHAAIATSFLEEKAKENTKEEL